MTSYEFVTVSGALASLILIGYALAGKVKLKSRLRLAACWALIAASAFLLPITWGRLLGVDALVTIYVLLMPILPWHRDSDSKKVTAP